MIRSASLAALCALGLSNVAQASLAATQLDTSTWTVNLTEVTVDQVNSHVYSELVGGGDFALSQQPPVTVIDGALTLVDTPATSTITITPPVTEPFEPPEGGWVTAPGFLSPAPVYPQQAGMTCSGAFSVTFGNQITVNCQADLWFTNGFVAAGQSIQANALGSILVDNVSFAAPVIQFNAGGNFITSINPMWLDGQTTINAQNVGLTGPVQVSSTGSLTINTPTIPEPGTWALMGLGLVGLSLAARRRA